MTWMVIRLVLSLAFIGGVLWFAARVAKKRGIGQGNGLIEVVARQRMGRASSVSVVRIADRVLVVGSTEEQVTLLAEVDGDVVEEAIAERRLAAQPALTGGPGAPGALAGSVFDRNGWTTFVSQLRERTVRR
ncbi:flagellar biosynthetic protein FliO [Geodermatophilus poikilotrophus]|uniref:Flagellar protein n=1 Tax=Geodermatophilus poikilotrophus TaxID=1333667 RepID=A0A1I0IKR4_9ACTN|nr:flagellar biosynthetic protein FliO [Geodermatophilus poikilotrophus]SET96871.1 flagellar protein FliO/FliZ [Geodermatophilus poikilotrophus]